MVSAASATGTITSGTSVGSTNLAKERIQSKLSGIDNRKPFFEPITLDLIERSQIMVNSLQNGWPIRPIGLSISSHNLRK
jgi:hypothetical protein